MLSIPVAAHTELFRWQLSLFWFAHAKHYGPQAASRVRAAVVSRNTDADPVINEVQWTTRCPTVLCRPFFELLNMPYSGSAVPLNIQAALLQMLPMLDESQVIEVMDCDMFHLRPTNYSVDHDMLLVDAVYEPWHLLSLSTNRHVIAPYFENGGRYYNGGFVPLVGTVRTFRRLMYEWIAVHQDILRRDFGAQSKDCYWWAGMFALQAACEKARVTMVDVRRTYIPPVNELLAEHDVVHYSVDPLFRKSMFPHTALNTAPDNAFYSTVRQWLPHYLQGTA